MVVDRALHRRRLCGARDESSAGGEGASDRTPIMAAAARQPNLAFMTQRLTHIAALSAASVNLGAFDARG
jgi:hypothetical protein